MAYTHSDDIVGVPQITTVIDAGVAQPQQGLTVKAFDSALGMGRFMWLTAQVALTVGQLATIDERTGATAVTVAASRGPMGVAMATLAVGQGGWFQVEGLATVVSAAAAAGAPGYVNAVAGSVINTVVAGNKVDGLIFKTANGVPPPASPTCRSRSPAPPATADPPITPLVPGCFLRASALGFFGPLDTATTGEIHGTRSFRFPRPKRLGSCSNAVRKKTAPRRSKTGSTRRVTSITS
jgi:hypothetical protein